MKLYTCLLFLSAVSPCLAQKAELPKDEKGKYIYYEVVDVNTISADSLLLRANAFVSFLKMTRIRKVDTAVSAGGKFMINKSLSALSHPSGEISYSFTAEMRNNKYRFWFTDFKFLPYARDRYSNYVPTSGAPIPLERQPGKLNASEWNGYIDGTAFQAKKTGDLFKSYMKNGGSSDMKQPPITKKW